MYCICRQCAKAYDNLFPLTSRTTFSYPLFNITKKATKEVVAINRFFLEIDSSSTRLIFNSDFLSFSTYSFGNVNFSASPVLPNFLCSSPSCSLLVHLWPYSMEISPYHSLFTFSLKIRESRNPKGLRSLKLILKNYEHSES